MEKQSLPQTTWPAIVILVLYLVVGALYAIATPIWQAPDEPAHYNYIRSLAEGRRVPVMEPGDYDQTYLSLLTSEGFPPELPVDPLEYEDHQPPLYYVLAVPVYKATGGAVLALRLFSLVLGGVGVAMVFLILRESWPDQRGIAWFGGGLVAFIPQFLAIMASVNNDSLTLALLWLWLWLALRYLRGRMSPWGLGAVAGALLLTKTTGYVVLPLTFVVLALRYRRNRMPWQWVAHQLVALFVPALVLGSLWWLRNTLVYGWPDLMGLGRHNVVAGGQLRTADAVAAQGGLLFLRDALRTTFRSFWGQFGWMGVVLDVRIYQALLILTSLTIYGAVWCLTEEARRRTDARQRDALVLLGAVALLTIVMYVGYNVTFVQHQGRYLFPALPFVGLAAALGWQRLLEFRLAVVTALILLAVMLFLGIEGLIAGDLPLWPVAMLGTAAVGLPLLGYVVPARWRGLLIAGLLLALVGLDLVCLFGFIVPILAS